MKRIVLTFGLIAGGLLFLFQLSKYTLMINQFDNELIITLFAVLFLGFGFWISKLVKSETKQIVTVQTDEKTINTLKIKELGISKREYEVLEKINDGLSNQEIASTLFISESTVKTHVSNLLSKLDARRRTHAILRAKEMGIL